MGATLCESVFNGLKSLNTAVPLGCRKFLPPIGQSGEECR